MYILGFVLFVLLSWASGAEATCSGSSPTFTAASPALADIKACVALASGGNTINVPAGSANWGGSTLSLTKGVQIIGAGIGNTVITSGFVDYVPSSSNWAANYNFRLSGFTFLGNGGSHTCWDSPCFLFLDAGCAVPAQTNMRVDHNRISNYSGSPAAIKLYGFRGVIDHNTFDLMGYVMRIGWGDHGTCSGTSGYGAGHWQIAQFGPFVFGDINTTIYFEDNTITGMNLIATDGDEGGSYVVRYNSFSGSTNGQVFDLHAHTGGASDWPTRGGEIYGNVWTTSGNDYFLKQQGAGRTLIFNNSVVDKVNSSFYQGDGCIQNSTTGDGLTGISMQVNNTYHWGNRIGFTGTLGHIDILQGSVQGGNQICNGRTAEKFDESIWQDNPSLTPGQALTSGIAKGTLVNRPTTCTPGTAYWATNQSTTSLAGMVGPNPSTPISGTLYQCSNVAYGPNGYDPTAGTANTWVTLFTPAPYPHPLISGGGGDVIPPAAPINLRVQ